MRVNIWPIINLYFYRKNKVGDKVQILELFGGIGAPRIALRNLGVPVKSIDYVEIDEKAVRSYNAMFADELAYKPQNVIGWNLKPDILVHGSPCQDFSIAGRQKGADENSGTRSSLMWETVKIISNMGKWKPKVVVWENVKNVLSKHMRHNFNKYLSFMDELGYVSSFDLLDARDYGIPQARQRVFTVSILGGPVFNFSEIGKRPMPMLANYLEDSTAVPPWYDVTQPSVLECIGQKGIRRATVINEFAYTITTRPDRTPAQLINCGNGRYRYLTERECWRLQGYTDEDFNRAAEVNSRRTLYHQAGNSIPIPVLEALFKPLLKLQSLENN